MVYLSSTVFAIHCVNFRAGRINKVIIIIDLVNLFSYWTAIKVAVLLDANFGSDIVI